MSTFIKWKKKKIAFHVGVYICTHFCSVMLKHMRLIELWLFINSFPGPAGGTSIIHGSSIELRSKKVYAFVNCLDHLPCMHACKDDNVLLMMIDMITLASIISSFGVSLLYHIFKCTCLHIYVRTCYY